MQIVRYTGCQREVLLVQVLRSPSLPRFLACPLPESFPYIQSRHAIIAYPRSMGHEVLGLRPRIHRLPSSDASFNSSGFVPIPSTNPER